MDWSSAFEDRHEVGFLSKLEMKLHVIDAKIGCCGQCVDCTDALCGRFRMGRLYVDPLFVINIDKNKIKYNYFREIAYITGEAGRKMWRRNYGHD